MRYRPKISITVSLLLSIIACSSSANTAIPNIPSDISYGKVLSEFTANLTSSKHPSKVVFAKDVKVTDPKITVSNPWQVAYPCDEKNSYGNAIIIIADTVHVLTACGELNSEEGDEMFIEKLPSTVIPQGSARSRLPDDVIKDLDVIMVPTPATIDTYIVWDGEKFVFTAPLEPEYR
ncbi:hypothetical protein ACFFLZ_01300 [Photobacterium aphoticum]|uniref:Lipoprotein n=1 Tax=Photobacterium aphoticum TaxID=754436 RepID=A0A0J1GJM5_9GAMM|nr:hypothetical protein [Photobacterium aphoticum]KLU99884.1 hypothetical protein ABT58_15585 [Photobacterium aphoticum]PSU56825.1 hypothetical protein C9I90_11485 [Photobacterium aphoticum]GHA40760.1 hypothetical protein GCM10007086_12980 [Photobacterium aphoticum]